MRSTRGWCDDRDRSRHRARGVVHEPDTCPQGTNRSTRGGTVRHRMTSRVAAAAAAATLILAACGGGGSSGASSSPGGQAGGGVFRTAVEGFGFTDGFDPTGEYLGA